MVAINNKKILIVGDSGRGKSTLAKKLSEKLNIKQYSTDDFYWKVKFTQPEEKEISLKKISGVYNQPSWIVEGSTRSLVKEGIDKSDLIIHLIYPNLVSQFWSLLKRKLTRKEERWIDLLLLYKHLFFKRYKLGLQKNKVDLDEMLTPFNKKVIRLSSYQEIDQFLENL